MDALIRLLNGLLMLAAPLALGVLIARLAKASWGLYAAGAVGFVCSQVLHIPFNVWMLNPTLKRLGLSLDADLGPSLIAGLLLGLSAGLFEETVRYAVFRVWQREARSWRDGLMLGAGHGGAEAIILGTLVLYGFFQALAYREAELATLLPAGVSEIAQAQLLAYWAAPWFEAILGTLERIFALCIHLSLSVLVLQALIRHRLSWLALAIGWHTLVDAMAVTALPRLGALGAEGLLGIMAAASLAIIFALRPREEPETISRPEIPPVQALTEEGPIDTERVEGSRYFE